MNLYLIRHADAVPVGEQGITDDGERPLTTTGVVQARGLATGLQGHGVRLDLVLSSPLVRARQTAEEMLRNWKQPSPELRPCEELEPGFKRRKLARVLRQCGAEAVALVGHQPDLGELAAWLIGSRRARIDLAKAGVAAINCDDDPGKGAGVLEWLVTADWLA